MWCVWDCSQGWTPLHRRHAAVGWVLDLAWAPGGISPSGVGAPPGGPALLVARDSAEITLDPLFRPAAAQGIVLPSSPLAAVWAVGFCAAGHRLAAVSSDGRLTVVCERSKNASTKMVHRSIVQLEDSRGGEGGGRDGVGGSGSGGGGCGSDGGGGAGASSAGYIGGSVGREGGGGGGDGRAVLLVRLGAAAEASGIPDAPAGTLQRASLRRVSWHPNRDQPDLLATAGSAGLLVCMEAPPAKQLG